MQHYLSSPPPPPPPKKKKKEMNMNCVIFYQKSKKLHNVSWWKFDFGILKLQSVAHLYHIAVESFVHGAC